MRILLLLLLLFPFSLSAQHLGNFKFKEIELKIDADCQEGLGNVYKGFNLNQIRLRSTVHFDPGFQLSALYKSDPVPGYKWSDLKNRNNRLTQFYLQYSNSVTVLNKQLAFNVYAGRLEYAPIYDDPKMYFDNIGFFDYQPVFDGAALKAYLFILDKGDLYAYIDAHTGDIFGKTKYKAMVSETYVSWTPEVYKSVKANLKVGKYPGSIYMINEAFLSYGKKIKFFRPIAEAGRLPGFDLAPFGFRAGGEIVTGYVNFGGYYEKRFSASRSMGNKYYTFFINVLKPKLLADILSNAAILYDPVTKSLRFKIPLINVKF